jgi:hypothetical protein
VTRQHSARTFSREQTGRETHAPTKMADDAVNADAYIMDL